MKKLIKIKRAFNHGNKYSWVILEAAPRGVLLKISQNWKEKTYARVSF